MKDLLEFIIKNIVNNKEQVEIKEITTEERGVKRVNFAISVAKEDMGTVIGKSGKTINSIRNIAKAKSIKDNTFVNIKVEDQ